MRSIHFDADAWEGSIHFDADAWEDFLYWLGADRKIATRITRLIREIRRDPFTGIGKSRASWPATTQCLWCGPAARRHSKRR